MLNKISRARLTLAKVVIPYSRFLEGHARRRTVVAELALREQPTPNEADVVPVPAGGQEYLIRREDKVVAVIDGDGTTKKK